MSTRELNIFDARFTFHDYSEEQFNAVSKILNKASEKPNGKSLFTSANVKEETIEFHLNPGARSVATTRGKPRIYLNIDDIQNQNPQYHPPFINSFGNVVNLSLTRVVIHELVHASLGLHDPFLTICFPGVSCLDEEDYIDSLSLPNADFKGDTVTRTNEVLKEMGVPTKRLHYHATPFLHLYGEAGTSWTEGNEIFNVYLGTRNGEVLKGGNKNELFFGDEGDDFINAGNGNDYIYGGVGKDSIFAFDGEDVIDGGEGNDVINGGEGNDKIDGGEGDDALNGSGGNDKIDGGKDDDALTGGEGKDTLNGGEGDDKLGGGKGDDTLTGGGDDDTIDGGKGENDIAIYTDVVDNYTFDISDDGKTVTIAHTGGDGADGTDTLTNVEFAEFTDRRGEDKVQLLGNKLDFVTDNVYGSVRDQRIGFNLRREGDTSFPVNIFVDGEVENRDDIPFNDFIQPLEAEADPSFNVRANNIRENFGDIAFTLKINIDEDNNPLAGLINIQDDDASGILYGDQVDDQGGYSFGDPHLITFDNIAYDFQASGDFILARAIEGAEYEVQVRFVSLSSAISVTQAMATSIDDITLSIESNGDTGTVLIDGESTVISDNESVVVGSGTITRTGQRYLIDHGNGDSTSVDVFSSFLNVTPLPSDSRSPGSLEGLLGDADGNPADDFQLADGTVLSTPIPSEVLYDEFAKSWLIPANESLLPGASQSFDAPDRIITIDSLPASLRTAAAEAVDAVGINNTTLREAAILDFALTGNEEFIEAARLADTSFNPIADTVPIDPVVNPVVVLTSDRAVLVEEDVDAQTALFTVARGSVEGDLTVNYSITGTGLNPAQANDFLNGSSSGSVTIADGTDSATFEVTVADDLIEEDIETFDVSIALAEEQASSFELLVSSINMSIESADEGTVPSEPSVAVDDSFSTNEDSELNGNVLLNDVNAGETSLTTLLLQSTNNGEVTLNDDGSFVYTPAPDFNGSDSFTYELSDGLTTDTGLVTIEVVAVNDAPVAVDDSAQTTQGTAVTLTVLENDIDQDSETVSIASFGTPANGVVSDNADGSLTYIPNDGFTGVDSFSYDISDEQGSTATASVSIEVQGSTEGVTIIGDTQQNTLTGGSGADTIAGEDGDDRILGNDGDDILRGDSNSRSSQFGLVGGNDFIDGGAGNDRIGGKSGNDTLLGGSGDDLIWGDDGDDIIRGGLGNDTLTGDDFSGGAGSDTFILASGEGTDTIVDFETGIDFIGLADGLSFGSITLETANRDTLIKSGDETLAIVQGVSALSESHFVVV